MYPLVGRLDRNRRTLGLVRISIHAPLAGCDDGDFRVGFFLDGISIHAPLAGCDECDSQQRYERLQISIHAPLAGCDHGGAPVRIPVPISIHAPLAGCDTATLTWQRSYEQFQSTHPLRGATQVLRLTELLSLVFQSTHPLRGATPRRTANRSGFPISIHAPLAGCDSSMLRSRYLKLYFNPRTPCGVRRLKSSGVPLPKLFQSTHPLRGATSARLLHTKRI